MLATRPRPQRTSTLEYSTELSVGQDTRVSKLHHFGSGEL